LFGILTDLHLTTARYSQATAFFYYAYAVSAFPMAILCQRFGKHLNIFLGVMVILWGVIVMLTPLCKDWRGLYAQRFFLGQVAAFLGVSVLRLTNAPFRVDLSKLPCHQDS
jgi:fucose permease